jgi:lipopolysaccharide export system protein LptA
MKRYSLIVIAVLGSLMVHAQTNTLDTLSTSRGLTQITAESGDFDLAGREATYRATYRGHVRVDDPQMKLTCEQLVADLPQAGGHPSHIVAETNVVIDLTNEKGQTNHATSDKAVYLYNVQNGVTNETVTLTGNAKVEQAQGWLTGEPIIIYCATRQIHADNTHMISKQNLTGTSADTNPPVTVVKTNFPPGTIENISNNIGDRPAF